MYYKSTLSISRRDLVRFGDVAEVLVRERLSASFARNLATKLTFTLPELSSVEPQRLPDGRHINEDIQTDYVVVSGEHWASVKSVILGIAATSPQSARLALLDVINEIENK